jgi:hypothetical protein
VLERAAAVRGGDVLRVRAFRGTRRSSLFREQLLAAAAVDSLQQAAARRGLTTIGTLGRDRSERRSKQQAAQLADELGILLRQLDLPELDAQLTQLLALTRWCARARGGAWLTLDRRTPTGLRDPAATWTKPREAAADQA